MCTITQRQYIFPKCVLLRSHDTQLSSKLIYGHVNPTADELRRVCHSNCSPLPKWRTRRSRWHIDTTRSFFQRYQGGDYATSLATEESEFDSGHGENFSFPWALGPAQTVIQQVRGTPSPRQREPGCEPDHYQLHLGQEGKTVSSSQYDCRT